MQGLYPIIRRKRRPLVVDEPVFPPVVPTQPAQPPFQPAPAAPAMVQATGRPSESLPDSVPGKTAAPSPNRARA